MADADRVQVVIRGRVYHLAGGDPEHTRGLARKVDDVMRQIGQGADNYKAAILAALHIADELVGAENEFARYRDRVDGAASLLSSALDEELGSEGADGAGDMEPPPAESGSADDAAAGPSSG